MKISDKQLSKIVKNILMEMPMDFDTPDRPHQDIQNKLTNQDTPITKVPLPQTGREPEQNFQELLGSERYRQIVQRIRRYVGLGGGQTIQGSAPSLIQAASGSQIRIMQIEGRHLEELSELAIRLVSKEMGIPEGSVQWDCRIEQPNTERFKRDQPNEENQPPVNPEAELNLADELESLNLERAKRRMINAMIQGSAAKGQYMFHMVEPELERITGSNDIINLYGILMSVLDTQYWQYADKSVKAMAASSVAGKEEVDRNTEPPTIFARGVNFPILVHEIVKGLMELFGVQGQPEDQEMAQQVEQLESTLEKETWDLRLGPSIWERLRSQFPEEVLQDENKRELQNWILVEIFKLPAKEFLVLTKEVISLSDNGKRLLQEIYDAVKALLNDEPAEEQTRIFEEDIEELAENTPDEDVDDILRQLGIGGESEPNTEAPTSTDKDLSGMGINALDFEMNKAIDDGNWELAQKIQKMIERKQGNQR